MADIAITLGSIGGPGYPVLICDYCWNWNQPFGTIKIIWALQKEQIYAIFRSESQRDTEPILYHLSNHYKLNEKF